MFLISETVSLNSFISFSIFSSFSTFTGSGFASSYLIFSCCFAETHMLNSKSMFMPNSFLPDIALLLSLVHFAVRCILHPHAMHSKDCSLAFVLLLQVLHVFSAIMLVFFCNRWCLRAPLEEIGLGNKFSPVVPKGTFGKSFGTCFSIE